MVPLTGLRHQIPDPHDLKDYTERIDLSKTFVQPKRLDNQEELKTGEQLGFERTLTKNMA
jgi:hypothetical protein